MSREIRAASFYRPAFEIGGRRRAGSDEDGFTLAVAAGEILAEAVPAGPVARIHYFGPPLPPEAVAGLPIALGAPTATAAVHGPTRSAFAAVLSEELGDGGNGAAVLVAAELGPHRPPPPGDRDGDGGAIALRIGPDGAPAVGPLGPTGPLPEGPGPGGEDSALRAAAEIGGAGGTVPTIVVSAAARPVPEAPWAREPAFGLDARSEGAYVPRATYLQNLPSRWRFAADRCQACGALTFPVRGRCRECGGAGALHREELSLRGGTVEAVTTIHPGAQPTEFDGMMTYGGAYDVVLVALRPGGRVTLQGTDRPEGGFRVGTTVDSALRRLYPMEGEWRYGRKAVPPRP